MFRRRNVQEVHSSPSAGMRPLPAYAYENRTQPDSQTLWFMQAYLKDLSFTQRDSKGFAICQRVLHKCHELTFEDFSSKQRGPYQSNRRPSRSETFRARMKPNAEPALVGIGCILAGVPGMPSLTSVLGAVALEQGRIEENNSDHRSIHDDGLTGGQVVNNGGSGDDDDDNVSQRGSDGDTKDSEGLNGGMLATPTDMSPLTSTWSPYPVAARTSPSLPLRPDIIPRSRGSEDPFGQLDEVSTIPSATAFQSSPAISHLKQSQRSNSTSAADLLLRQYDLQSQIQILQSHYCHSEVNVHCDQGTL